MPRPKSRAQARFFGAVRGGAAKARGFSKSEAGNSLRGIKFKGLPARARKGKKS